MLVQRKRTKRKDTFSKVFLSRKWTKPQGFPKFSPRLQKFLTENLVILRKKTISKSILILVYVELTLIIRLNDNLKLLLAVVVLKRKNTLSPGCLSLKKRVENPVGFLVSYTYFIVLLSFSLLAHPSTALRVQKQTKRIPKIVGSAFGSYYFYSLLRSS